LYQWYSAKTRSYTFKKIKIRVFPGVFHPAFFFSTKTLIEFLETQNLNRTKVLELGAGTGLISIYCKLQGAEKVCASDISSSAIENILENIGINNIEVDVVHSDLFEKIDPNAFDIIIINPPYYPKKIKTETDYPWFCGESFEYFEKLFLQLNQKRTVKNKIYMIISEDCDIDKIKKLSIKNNQQLKNIYAVRKLGEWNYIFSITG
jgi:release factor glutamine methyltransferase